MSPGGARSAAALGLVCVGTELLRGQVNTHQSYLCRRLQSAGLFVARECSLPDDQKAIAAVIRIWSRECDALIVCGGLGPTFDDITREATAAALGRAMTYQPRIYKDILRKFRRRSLSVPEENRRQAFVIDGAEVLANGPGSAPGQWIEWLAGRRRRAIALLPGPFDEMSPMFEREVLPRLKRRFARGVAAAHLVVHITGLPESVADERLAPVTASAGPRLDFTILTGIGQVDYHATATAASPAQARRTLTQVRRRIYQALSEHIFGEGAATLESTAGDWLRRRRLTLAVAESCTGGGLGQRLTAVPGSSVYFLGGVLAYSNALKRRLLGVSSRTLSRHGAVSAPCAVEMAIGARRATGASVAVSITGVAGPGGGTRAKPIGLVYLGLAAVDGAWSRELRLAGAREAVRARAAAAALAWLIERLKI